MRTTPTPALPGAVATAMMGSFLVIIAVPFSLNAKPSKNYLATFLQTFG
jgi:hypothetical protein